MKNIANLIFDLDGTLYPNSLNIEELFKNNAVDYLEKTNNLSKDEIEKSFAKFKKDTSVFKNADKENFDIEAFFEYVCDVDVSKITKNKRLKEQLNNLDKNLIIYTNSTLKHTNDVLERLSLNSMFKKVYTIETADYEPKPNKEAFDKFFDFYKIKPQECIMFEDSKYNLKTAKELGMITVFISEDMPDKSDYADFIAENINDALEKIYLLKIDQ